ncbi:histidine kinase dimerization/phosphoacceptor domain -containing protein [Polaribacter sp.]|uniref:histidine kinase dimerization/phosphoacceptor domain -containing protein n=1 Tax=Polaribacter sp. TaxID=1920175 RepID=UPI003F6B08DA
MKCLFIKSFKTALIVVFFLLSSLQSFSNNLFQDTNQLKEIQKIESIIEQYRYFNRFFYVSNNEFEDIDEWIRFFEKQKTKYNQQTEVVYINFILVYLYQTNYNLDKAIELGLSTYYSKFKIPNKNRFLCNLLNIVEWCYHKKDNNLQLIKINKEKFKVCGKGAVNYHSAYYNMGLYDLALKSYKEYIGYDKPSYKNYDLYNQAFHNNDIGVYYMYDNKIDSAIYHYNKAITLFKNQITKDSTYKAKDITLMLSVTRGNIATCFLKKGKYKEAIPLYLNEIKVISSYYNGKNWIDSDKSYRRIALCYIKTNQFKKARVYINKIKKYKDQYYKLKSEYYSQLGNKDSTLFFKNRYIKTSDSIYKQKIMQKDIESLNTLALNDKIKRQQHQIANLEAVDIAKSNKIKIYLVTSFIVVILFLLLLYLYYNVKQKNKIVEAQKNKIECTLNSNKILLKELNHRVKNNLQMVSSVISLQASKLKDTKSKQHFNAAINRIKVLSKIHNSLFSQDELNEIDVLSYVTTLKDYLINSITNPEIKVDFYIDIQPNLYINNDKKTILGLIINELITNSYKYAFTNTTKNVITISIYEKDNNYLFSYKDNGQGFDYENLDKTKSIGLNLIFRLVNQLGEEAEINTKEGVHISFSFNA